MFRNNIWDFGQLLPHYDNTVNTASSPQTQTPRHPNIISVGMQKTQDVLSVPVHILQATGKEVMSLFPTGGKDSQLSPEQLKKAKQYIHEHAKTLNPHLQGSDLNHVHVHVMPKGQSLGSPPVGSAPVVPLGSAQLAEASQPQATMGSAQSAVPSPPQATIGSLPGASALPAAVGSVPTAGVPPPQVPSGSPVQVQSPPTAPAAGAPLPPSQPLGIVAPTSPTPTALPAPSPVAAPPTVQ